MEPPIYRGLHTILSFLNCIKYPPSLDFLLMTLGPSIFALSLLNGRQFSPSNPVVVFGRVPFFYYACHFLLAHLISIALEFIRYGNQPFVFMLPPSIGSPRELFPPNFGFPLWTTYAVWLVVLLAMYPLCLWFSRLKNRRRDWWLSYL